METKHSSAAIQESPRSKDTAAMPLDKSTFDLRYAELKGTKFHRLLFMEQYVDVSLALPNMGYSLAEIVESRAESTYTL